MKFKLVAMMMVMASASVACASFRRAKPLPLPTVETVSLGQYVGKWYAITALPQIFTRKCVAQTADYALLSESQISVLNTCIKKKGKTSDIEGYAIATETPGVLKLRFTEGIPGFFGIKADYNIIKLDPEYRYALIGGEDRKSLWLLSRTKTVSDEVYNAYIGRAAELGFNTSKLRDSKF